jgi:hypothetical protein
MDNVKYVDTYYYGAGYYCSYVLTVCCIADVFSILVPSIGLLPVLYFLQIHFIAKYNLTFNYKKEFTGRGIFKKKFNFFIMLIMIIV